MAIIMECGHCNGTGTCQREYHEYDRTYYSCSECRDAAHEKTGTYPGHYGKVVCSVCGGTGKVVAE